MDYQGAKVTHAKYGEGTITKVNDTHVFIRFDSLKEEIKKFPFPQCFEKFIHLDDSELKESASSLVDQARMEEQKRLDAEKEQLRNEVLAMQKVTMTSRQAKLATMGEKPKRRSSSRRKTAGAAKKPSAVTSSPSPASFTEGLEQALEITVSDPWTFASAGDILKQVFHIDEEAWNREFYYFDEARTKAVWFVRLPGPLSSDTSAETWAYERKDPSVIRMYTRSLSLSYHSTADEPLFVFTRVPGELYRFAGVFQRDIEHTSPRDVWFNRISESLDLTPWRL